MKRIFFAALTMASLAFTQEVKVDERELRDKESRMIREAMQPRRQKIFQVKYANVESLQNIFQNIATVRADRNMRVLAVEGTAEAIAAIEDALKRLDVPPEPVKNIELVFTMILAKPAKDGSLPADLQSVQRNLESLFGFKGFQVIETAVIRTRDGIRVDSSGALQWPVDPKAQMIPTSTYQLQAQPAISTMEKGYIVRIDNLRFGMKVPVIVATLPNIQYNYRDMGINTSIDVRDGQKVVVGKSNVDGSDGAVILVVTAKVVD